MPSSLLKTLIIDEPFGLNSKSIQVEVKPFHLRLTNFEAETKVSMDFIVSIFQVL